MAKKKQEKIAAQISIEESKDLEIKQEALHSISRGESDTLNKFLSDSDKELLDALNSAVVPDVVEVEKLSKKTIIEGVLTSAIDLSTISPYKGNLLDQVGRYQKTLGEIQKLENLLAIQKDVASKQEAVIIFLEDKIYEEYLASV